MHHTSQQPERQVAKTGPEAPEVTGKERPWPKIIPNTLKVLIYEPVGK